MKVLLSGMKGILLRPATCACTYVWMIEAPSGKLSAVSALLSLTINTSV